MVIFDIDGFLMNVSEEKKQILNNTNLQDINWAVFLKDTQNTSPINAGIMIVKSFLNYLPQMDIMFLTARSEISQDETLEWLSKNLCIDKNDIDLTMRPFDNIEKDVIFKEKVGKELGFSNIDLVFDDSPDIINMWIKHKVPCCQFFT